MKKILLSLLFSAIFIAVFSQRFEVETSTNLANFKRHFTYSIEAGFVDNLPRQFVAGNKSDFLVNGADVIQGNSFVGTAPYPGKSATFQAFPTDEKMLLTDFVVPKQGGNALYAYGTGIYFPDGAGLSGYVN